MLYKLIDSQSFFPDNEVNVSLLNLKDTDSSGLEKLAVDDAISAYVKHSLRPESGYFYLHINAMGAGEYYGSNRNADYFPEGQLKKFHKTFEETGYVYRHHINKDPAKSIGKVIFSIYNDRMHRVELIAKLSLESARDIYDRIANGDLPKTSMGCRTPYDVCSICGNEAYTPQKYCSHMKEMPNKVLPDGKKVMAINSGPLRFFDISVVIKPADQTSSVLQKVANIAPRFPWGKPRREDTLLGGTLSTDYASAEGIDDSFFNSRYFNFLHPMSSGMLKSASMRKLSELIKRIDSGQVMGILPVEEDMMSKTDSYFSEDDEVLRTLSSVPLDQVFNAFAEVGVIPTTSFLANIIGRHHAGRDLPKEFGTLAEEVSASIPSHLLVNSGANFLPDIPEIDADSFILKYLRESPLVARVKQAMLYDGYVDTSEYYPKMYYTGKEKEEAQAMVKSNLAQQASGNPNFMKLLIGVGGAAILAKMVISELVQAKIDKLQENKLKSQGMLNAAALAERSIIREQLHANKQVGLL